MSRHEGFGEFAEEPDDYDRSESSDDNSDQFDDFSIGEYKGQGDAENEAQGQSEYEPPTHRDGTTPDEASSDPELAAREAAGDSDLFAELLRDPEFTERIEDAIKEHNAANDTAIPFATEIDKEVKDLSAGQLREIFDIPSAGENKDGLESHKATPRSKIEDSVKEQFQDWHDLRETVGVAVDSNDLGKLEDLAHKNVLDVADLVNQVTNLCENDRIEGPDSGGQAKSVEAAHWNFASRDSTVAVRVRPLSESADTENITGMGAWDVARDWPFYGLSEMTISTDQTMRMAENPAKRFILRTNLNVHVGYDTGTLNAVDAQFLEVTADGQANETTTADSSAMLRQKYLQQFIPEEFEPTGDLPEDVLQKDVCDRIAISSAKFQISTAYHKDMSSPFEKPANEQADTLEDRAAANIEEAMIFEWQKARFEAEQIAAHISGVESDLDIEAKLVYATTLADLAVLYGMDGNADAVREYILKLEIVYHHDNFPGQLANLARATYAGAIARLPGMDADLAGRLDRDSVDSAFLDARLFSFEGTKSQDRYTLLREVLSEIDDPDIALRWINRYVEGVDNWELKFQYLSNKVSDFQVGREELVDAAGDLFQKTIEGKLEFKPDDIVMRGPEALALLRPGDSGRAKLFEFYADEAQAANTTLDNLCRLVDMANIAFEQAHTSPSIRDGTLPKLHKLIDAQLDFLRVQGEVTENVLTELLLQYMANKTVMAEHGTTDETADLVDDATSMLLNMKDENTTTENRIMAQYDKALGSAAKVVMSNFQNPTNTSAARTLIENISDSGRRDAAMVECWGLAENSRTLAVLAPGDNEDPAITWLYNAVGKELLETDPKILGRSINNLLARVRNTTDTTLDFEPVRPEVFVRLTDMLLDRIKYYGSRYETDAVINMISQLRNAPGPYNTIEFQQPYYTRLLKSPNATPAHHTLIHKAIQATADPPIAKAGALLRYAKNAFNKLSKRQ